MIAIRRASTADSATLAQLGRDTFCQTFAHLYAAEDLTVFLATNHSVDYYKSALSSDGTAAWLAETQDHQPVAYALAGACRLPVQNMPNNAGEIKRIYVRESHQRQGLGQKLFTPLMQYLRTRFEAIYLGVYSENQSAQQFYRQAGFEKSGEYTFYVGQHQDREWIMEWQGSSRADKS